MEGLKDQVEEILQNKNKMIELKIENARKWEACPITKKRKAGGGGSNNRNKNKKPEGK